MINKGMFTSKRQNWKTPKEIYDKLNSEFNFDYDPCLIETETIHFKDMLGSNWGGKDIC